MRLVSLPLLVLGLLAFVVPGPLQADEWWAWTMLDFVHEAPWTVSVFAGHRFDDADAFTAAFVSPRVHYEAAPWLDLGLNLTLLDIANPRTSERTSQLRPELELNPKLNLTPHLRLDLRNRFESRWNEDESLTTHRTRHRAQLAWTFPHALGPWTRVFISNEWLIDLHRQNWVENRCVPLGLTFRTGPQADLDLFYMIDSTRPRQDWRHESILGTYLRLRF